MDSTYAKNLIINFDDGRKDVYKNAFPIMKKNNLVATVYLITGTLDNSFKPKQGFLSGERKFLTIDEIIEMKEFGFEFSSHSKDHSNDIDMIQKSFNDLKKFKLIEKDFISFSSPKSEINQYNYSKFNLDKFKLKYLRTGVQMKNESFFNKILFFVQKYFKSKTAFYLLNKNNIMDNSNFFIKTVAIRNYNTVEQIDYLLRKVKSNQTCVLLFHSITLDEDGIDTWGFSKEKFDIVCTLIRKYGFSNMTVKDFVIKYSEHGGKNDC